VESRERTESSVESCPHRRVLLESDGETAACGVLAKVLGGDHPCSTHVSRQVCESCLRSFPPTPSSPNPVVASLLYSRSLKLANSTASAQEARRIRSVVELATTWLEFIHAEPASHIQETPLRDPRSLAELVPPPRDRLGPRVHEWAVGVTTSPRLKPTLETCVRSLERAGWARPRLFIDGAVKIPGEFSELPFTLRDEKCGAWPGYLLALMELLLRQPRSDAYLIVQDDTLLADFEPMRLYLEKLLWPGTRPGLVSLFCSATDASMSATPGWHAARGVAGSAPLAVVFPRSLAKAFVSDPAVLEHRWAPDEIDGTTIGDLIPHWAHSHGIPFWLPTPSLAQHIGDTSTLWPISRFTGARRAGLFAGDDSRLGEQEY
jgi:hypothetical protein